MGVKRIGQKKLKEKFEHYKGLIENEHKQSDEIALSQMIEPAAKAVENLINSGEKRNIRQDYRSVAQSYIETIKTDSGKFIYIKYTDEEVLEGIKPIEYNYQKEEVDGVDWILESERQIPYETLKQNGFIGSVWSEMDLNDIYEIKMVTFDRAYGKSVILIGKDAKTNRINYTNVHKIVGAIPAVAKSYKSDSGRYSYFYSHNKRLCEIGTTLSRHISKGEEKIYIEKKEKYAISEGKVDARIYYNASANLKAKTLKSGKFIEGQKVKTVCDKLSADLYKTFDSTEGKGLESNLTLGVENNQAISFNNGERTISGDYVVRGSLKVQNRIDSMAMGFVNMCDDLLDVYAEDLLPKEEEFVR